MALSRKTVGAVSTVTSTTISPAYGATPVAGNLLVAVCWARGASSNIWNAAPSGWTRAFLPTSDSIFCLVVYTKIAAGGDAAPTFTWGGGSIELNAFISEVQGGPGGLDQATLVGTSSTSPVTAQNASVDAAVGDYVIGGVLESLTKAGTDTTSLAFNNGVAGTAITDNDASSIISHYRWADGVTTSAAAGDSCQGSAASMNIQDLCAVVLSVSAKGTATATDTGLTISDSLGKTTSKTLTDTGLTITTTLAVPKARTLTDTGLGPSPLVAFPLGG